MNGDLLKILVIDDEEVIRSNIAAFLEDSGFYVLQADNGMSGLKAFRETKPEAVILDLRMPVMDGLEALPRIVEESPETPVIIISGLGTLDDVIQALRLGAWDYITKPISDLTFLEHTIGKAMERVRLIRDNRHYREHLEDEVRKRTEELKMTADRLEQEAAMNRDLLRIAKATRETTDLNGLMQTVTENLNRMIGSDMCLGYIWLPETNYFSPSASAGLDSKSIPFFRTGTLTQEIPFIRDALADNRIVSIPWSEIRTENLWSWIKVPMSAVVIPLSSSHLPLGLLFCLFRSEDDTNKKSLLERDLSFVQGVSDQVSVALAEVKLYNDSLRNMMDLSRKVETIQAMHEIDRSILSSLKPQEIIETSVSMITRVIACDCAAVFMHSRETGELTYNFGFGKTSLLDSSMPAADPSIRLVVETMRPVYISGKSEKLATAGAIGTVCPESSSRLIVPINMKERAIGALFIGSNRESAFAPEDVSILEKISAQIGVALENARLLTDLEELFLGMIRSLSAAIDAKSSWTSGHSSRVTEYALKIGREMGLESDDLKLLEYSGLLHDIGKIGTYEDILNKQGALTEEEWTEVRKHPGKGAEILSPIIQLNRLTDIIKHHHEYYDGTGYPDGIAGEAIPVLSRILTLADSFEAMRGDRPYRNGMEMATIVEEVKSCSGRQFDPEVVRAFLVLYERGVL